MKRPKQRRRKKWKLRVLKLRNLRLQELLMRLYLNKRKMISERVHIACKVSKYS